MRIAIFACISFLALSCGESNREVAMTEEATNASCVPPSNPYSAGTGHYAGFEWAESKDADSCGGNSASFVEGCEEYVRLATAYEECAK